VSLIWKSLSTKGRWFKSRWVVVIGQTSIATGVAILSSCLFKNGEKGFQSNCGNLVQLQSNCGFVGVALLNYLITSCN